MAHSQSAAPRIPLSLRLPAHVIEAVDGYAHEHGMSKTDAFLHFLRKGIEAEQPAQAESLDEIKRELAQIKQMLADARPAPTTSQASVREAVSQAASRFPAIKRAYLFGSFARGDFGAGSDVDVRIELDPSQPFNLHDLAHLQKSIEKATGRDVDIVSARVVKNPNLAAAIEREKVLAYERQKR